MRVNNPPSQVATQKPEYDNSCPIKLKETINTIRDHCMNVVSDINLPSMIGPSDPTSAKLPRLLYNLNHYVENLQHYSQNAPTVVQDEWTKEVGFADKETDWMKKTIAKMNIACASRSWNICYNKLRNGEPHEQFDDCLPAIQRSSNWRLVFGESEFNRKR